MVMEKVPEMVACEAITAAMVDRITSGYTLQLPSCWKKGLEMASGWLISSAPWPR
ncbi:hypothetical protein D3C86_2242100 [compost metagenome]